MLRILIAPDKFKGSLTSFEVCAAIEKGLLSASPDLAIKRLPLADGGDGLLDIMVYYTSAERRFSKVQDPLMRPITACWLLSVDRKTAFIEMAGASGLRVLEPS